MPKCQKSTAIANSLSAKTRATAADGGLARVYLSGGAARTPGLSRAISRQTGLPCEVADPFQRVQIDEREFKEGFLDDVAPQAAVVVGLAMRSAG